MPGAMSPALIVETFIPMYGAVLTVCAPLPTFKPLSHFSVDILDRVEACKDLSPNSEVATPNNGGRAFAKYLLRMNLDRTSLPILLATSKISEALSVVFGLLSATSQSIWS